MTTEELEQYRAGYQEALADVLVQLNAGGEGAARAWIKHGSDRTKEVSR